MSLTLQESFQHVRLRKQIGFVPYIVAGHPDLETTVKLLLALDSLNVTCIELGIPHTDQLADGPVIQNAAVQAIQNGVTPEHILTMIGSLELSTPIVIFCSYNLVLAQGDQFLAKLSSANVKGLLIPDLPPEEAVDMKEQACHYGIDMIYLVPPTANAERTRYIVQECEGFIYVVSTTGITGERDKLPEDLIEKIQYIKSLTNKPVVVGFGVSKREHVAMLQEMGADGAVVGTVIVKSISECHRDEIISAVCDLVLELTGSS